MHLKHIRLRIPDIARQRRKNIKHDVWTIFEFRRIITPTTRFSEVEIARDGELYRAFFKDMEIFPKIVTTTHDHDCFFACTTFDVDFARPQKIGFIPVIEPQTKKALELPSKIVAPALRHAFNDPYAV